MKQYIEERTLECASFIITNGATIRETAKKYGISKSTVYNDILLRLPVLNKTMTIGVHQVLTVNKKERHLRGGLATKKKYESIK